MQKGVVVDLLDEEIRLHKWDTGPGKMTVRGMGKLGTLHH
jgi:hypothetical protein